MDSNQNQRGIKPNGGSHDSDAILSDIRYTRSRMDHTLDELGDKLQPRHLVEEAVDYFWTREKHMAGKAKQSASQIGHKVVAEVREHPLPSLLIGAGVIWLLSQQRQKERFPEGDSGPGFKEKAQQMFGAAKEKLHGAGESLKEKASSASEGSREKLGSAKEKLGSAWESTREKTSEVKEKASDFYHQKAASVRQASETHPLAMGLVSMAAGVLAGVLTPRTRMEDRAFGSTADRIKEEGRRQAEAVAEAAKSTAPQGSESFRSSQGQREDLTPEGLTGRSEEFSAPEGLTGRSEEFSAPGEPKAGPGI